jgi:hypothetical protein
LSFERKTRSGHASILYRQDPRRAASTPPCPVGALGAATEATACGGGAVCATMDALTYLSIQEFQP